MGIAKRWPRRLFLGSSVGRAAGCYPPCRKFDSCPGSFSGSTHPPPHPSHPPARKNGSPGVWRFGPTHTEFSDARPSGSAISVSRESFRGPKGTLKVATAPRNLWPKVSESLIHTPPKVNTPVAFGTRMRRYEITRVVSGLLVRHGCDAALRAEECVVDSFL